MPQRNPFYLKATWIGKAIIASLIIVYCQPVEGQNTIGLPIVTNFSNGNLYAGAQNWMVTQDRFGILYFGNTYGLLVFNGFDWQLFRLPNKTLVRSLKIGNEGKIYAGGQDEFGYFFPSSNGTLQFHSLIGLIPEEDRKFGDVWNTEIVGRDIFFRTNRRIFKIDSSKKITIFKPSSEWCYMGSAEGVLYAQDKNYGLYEYHQNEWELITRQLNTQNITSILPFEKGSTLVTTLRDGVYILSDHKISRLAIDPKIASYHIYTAIRMDDHSFALGTTSDGVYFIDKSGNTIRHLSRQTRLQNNNVVSMFMDNQSNLWLGLDKGIDLVSYNSAIQKINPVYSTPSACYAARIFDNKLYIGTSDGLYYAPLTVPPTSDLSFSKGTFTRVNNTGGQVWGLSATPGNLLMAYNDGTYEITRNTAVPLFKDEGSWTYVSLPPTAAGDSPDIIAGTYLGLHLLKDRNGKITDSGKIDGLSESLRFLQIDSARRTLWSSHPYHGIYKIQLSSDSRYIESAKLYTHTEGLPSDLDNYVYRIGQRIVVCTNKGIYRYNQRTDRFERDPEFEPIFGNLSLSVIKMDEDHNYWFVTENRLGVVLHKTGTISYFPEITGILISGFEFIYPVNEKNIFIGSSDGLVHINAFTYQQKKNNFKLVLNKVVALGDKDSLLFNGYFTYQGRLLTHQSPHQILELPARYNSYHFEFANTSYRRPNDIQYSYQLDGIDKTWSRWSEKGEKDYTNLPYGKYLFKVKARDNLQRESEIMEYTFRIKPHWYQTNLAYICYGLLTLLLLTLFNRQQSRKFEKQTRKFEEEQQHLNYLHQLEIEHNEREIIQLQKEKLENEVSFKNKELASTTMHLFKRGKLLNKLKDELLQAVKELPEKEKNSDFKRLIKMLKEAEKQDQDWEQFSIHFDDVHNNFLKNMKQNFPELTSSDLKICAYLKMNLSSKQIAQLLNISLKGVEVARYRLRKKLNLSSSGINLHDFLINNT